MSVKISVFLLYVLIGVVIGFIVGVGVAREIVSPESRTTITETVYRVSQNNIILLDREYYETLASWLSKANKSVYIIMYVIKYDPKDPSDIVNNLLNILIDLKKRGIEVRILVDDETLRSYPETLNFLKKNNLSVRLDESSSKTTHAKIVVIDDQIVFIGSHNWTESALKYNHEVSVLIIDHSTASILKRYFENIWSSGRSI
ncbi:MAG: phospholipase D-like domain-containing protein [Sulfolobales archaeon]